MATYWEKLEKRKFALLTPLHGLTPINQNISSREIGSERHMTEKFVCIAVLRQLHAFKVDLCLL